MNFHQDTHRNIRMKESPLVGRALINFTSVFVSLGVFLFGFEQGLMSSLLTNKFFLSYFHHPSPVAIGTMIAILEIGALFSSFVAGKVADSLGRRLTIRWGSFIFVVGAFLQSISVDIFSLGVGRFIGGIAIGFLTTCIPCYQSEISPAEDRGFYACLEFTGNIIGYAASIWVDYCFSFLQGNVSWRAPLSVQVLVGLTLFTGSFLIVETPRWLLDHDHDIEGMIVISDLYTDGDVEDEVARNEFKNVKENILLDRVEGGERSYKYMLKRYSKRVSIPCFSQMFAQMNGINVISYYAPMIFEQAGWFGRDAILMTGFNSLIYVLSTIPPWYLVDSWGRKPLLLLGAILMGVPLVIISYSLSVNNNYTARVVVSSVFFFNAAFGASWGPIPWMMNEVLPNNVRSKGAAMATATNWLFNFAVGEMTPILLDKIAWRTYLIPASSCFLSFFCVKFLFPETKGLSLEDMGSVFDDKSSIFSFHSSFSNSTSSSALNYGSTYETESRRAESSFGQDHSNLHYKTAASMARDPASSKTTFDTTGRSAVIPHEFSGLESSSNDLIPTGIIPPTFDTIYQFKLRELETPSRLNKILNSIFDKLPF